MRKAFWYGFGLMALYLLLLPQGSAFACDFDTTSGRMQAFHTYTIHNDGQCSYDYSIAVSTNTTGGVYIEANTINTSGTLGAGQSRTVGYVQFRALQCDEGTGSSSITVTATGSCGSTTFGESATTTFCSSCGGTLGCNASGQCVTGGTGGACEVNGDCRHLECNDNTQQCVTVNTPGSNQDGCTSVGQACNQPLGCNASGQCVTGGTGGACEVNGDCRHLECNDNTQQCVTVNTPGSNQDGCTTVGQPCNQPLGCNASGQCVTGGTGGACEVNGDCRHLECNDNTQQCVTVNTPGSNQDGCTTVGQPCGLSYCADTNSDGLYDACNTSGSGPTCTNVITCTRLACTASGQCATQNGGGADQCDNDPDCYHLECNDTTNQCIRVNIPGPNQDDCTTTGQACGETRCADSDGNGVYDACNESGTGPSCANVGECTRRQCNVLSQCVTVNGGGVDTCQTDPDCLIYWCLPNTGETSCTHSGTLADCLAAGVPQLNCFSVQTECTVVAPQNCALTRCEDADSNGVYDSCIVNGNSNVSCENIDDCTATLGCNELDQCVSGGTEGNCNVNADCQPATSFFYCTSATQCASSTTCPTGSTCYGTQQGCTDNALINCGPRCNDTDGDGDYDSCETNGNSNISCVNVGTCTAILGCNDLNQCVPGGTEGNCNVNADCSTSLTRCNDSNNDGTYDGCIVNGNSNISCEDINDCTDTLGCNDLDQCVRGGTEGSCTVNADCSPAIACNDLCDPADDQCGTPRECRDVGNTNTNADWRCRNPSCENQTDCTCGPVGDTSCNTGCGTVGIGNLCADGTECINVGGAPTCRNTANDNGSAWPRSCPLVENCICGTTGSFRCYDSDNNNSYDACNERGQGPYCTTLSECQPPPNRCYDSDQNGVYDACSPLGAGRTCGSLSDCRGTGGTSGCNSDHVCVQGGTGRSCTTNNDCRGTSGPFCGDNIRQDPEQCDDGNNRDDGNGCTADCRLYFNYCWDNTPNDNNNRADSCGQSGTTPGAIRMGGCATMSECNRVTPHGCQACGCVEKTVDPPIAGDNQTVTYTVIISNKAQISGAPFTPYEIVIYDSIFQKKKYIDNNIIPPSSPGDPPGGVEDYLSTEGYIEYPDHICITEQTDPDTIVLGIDGDEPDGRGCFYYTPGVNIGDPSVVPGGSAPAFTINHLTPGNQVTFTYQGKARTTFNGHELGDTTQFVDVTNEVRSQTNNDYANVTVSKPYLITRNSGNILIGSDPTDASNVSNLALALGNDPDLFRNVAGLILSPLQSIKNLTTYLSILTQYVGFDSEDLAAQLDKNTQNIIRNTSPSASYTNTVTTEAGLDNLGKRPDGARIFVSDGALTVNLTDTISKVETVVVKNGDLIINSDIKYTAVARDPNDVPSIAFVVLNGNIVIGPNVQRLDGVYIVKNAAFSFTGPVSAKQLVVNGSLFGDVNNLLKTRTWVGLPEDDGGSVVVNYDARILSNTPPGLKDILGGIIFQQVAQ